MSVYEYTQRIVNLNTAVLDLIPDIKNMFAMAPVTGGFLHTQDLITEGFKLGAKAAKAQAAAILQATEAEREYQQSRADWGELGRAGKDAQIDAITGGSIPRDFTGFKDVALDAGGALKSTSWDELWQGVDKNFGTMTESMKKFIEAEKKANDVATAMESTFQSVGATLGDTLVDAANGADVSWSKFGANLLETFEKAIAKALILEAIGGTGAGILPGMPGAGGSGILGALFGGANGFDARVPGGRGTFLPGFANGGDMLVGGSGGTDSKIAAFRVTPGETIHVRTPQQQQAMQQQGAPQPIVIQNHIDVEARALAAIGNGSADNHIVNAIRRNPGALRTILSK